MGAAQPEAWPTPPARILVVDDMDANRLAMSAVLEPLGQEIIEARSGEEALGRRRCSNDFAVILMDVQMPGMDGFQTVQLLRQRERTRYTPVIFVTAFGDLAPVARGYGLGAIDFLTKPYDAGVVRARVGALTQLWQRGQQLEMQAEELRRQAVASERERAAREAAEAANRMKDEFLAMVSHELRTPLNAIVGWAELLASGALPAERVTHGLETIARNARIQARLIEDLLDVSRIIAGKLAVTRGPLDLAAIVRRAVETVAPQAGTRNIALEVQIAPGDHDLIGDATRLQQVVWNLLSNAVKFSPEGGQVTMTLVARRGSGDPRGRAIAAAASMRRFFPTCSSASARPRGRARASRAGSGSGWRSRGTSSSCTAARIEAASPGLGAGATFTVRPAVARAAEGGADGGVGGRAQRAGDGAAGRR